MESAKQNGVALSLWLLGQNFFLVNDKTINGASRQG